ncbi:hypothetical protein TcG_07192 [Trypanosoma cruzi]|nr:hypothetical protein TcG_07192 [Trypanosoma cruzi]
MKGEEWREMRERGGQESRWVSRRGGPCPPNAAPLLSGTLSITLQHRNRRQQHAARQRMPPPPRVRLKGRRLLLPFEAAHRVAQWRAPNLLADSAHDTGHWPRSFCVMEDTAVESLFPPCGRTPEFPLFPTQAGCCAMTPQRGSCFHHGGATSAGLRIGNMNGECSKKGSVMALFCCANCVNFS